MISVYSGHQVDLPHLRHNGGRRATEKTGRLFGCLLDYGRLVWCFFVKYGHSGVCCMLHQVTFILLWSNTLLFVMDSSGGILC